MNQLKLFFASQAFHSFYHAVLAGASGFVVANGMNPSKAWMTGLATAVLGAIVGWLNGSPTGTNPAVQPNVPQPTGQKIGMFLAFFLMAGMASANPLAAIAQPPAGGEDVFVVAPIGSIEFNPTTKDNYGLAFTECISFAKVLPGQDANHVMVSPYVFVGIFGAANIGDWVAANGGAAWQFDYGPMVGLPKLDDTLPEVAFSYNLRTSQFMINAAFPVDILPSILVHKL